MLQDPWEKIDLFLLDMVKAQQIPGAVYAVIDANKVIAENAIGYAYLGNKQSMQLDTLFDLASLTKICATTMSIFVLIEQGLVDLDDPLHRFFANSDHHLTVRHLLTHTTGYPPTIPFYKYGWTKEKLLIEILAEEAVPDKQVVYSDLNFILLGMLIEKVSGQSLDHFTNNMIYQPLGMRHTGFNPKVERDKIAPTEWLESENKYQWGKVHDENAYYLGGVSGHAGLFSNLKDMKRFVQMLLKEGLNEDGDKVFSQAVLRASHNNYTKGLNHHRGLGWQLVDEVNSPAGQLLSKQSYGHTGFTGTSIWIDPDRKIGMILLTNRVHISRDIDMNRIRRIFHNLAVMALD